MVRKAISTPENFGVRCDVYDKEAVESAVAYWVERENRYDPPEAFVVVYKSRTGLMEVSMMTAAERAALGNVNYIQ